MRFYQQLLDKIFLLEKHIKERKEKERLSPWYLSLAPGQKQTAPRFNAAGSWEHFKLSFYKFLLSLTRIYLIIRGAPASNFNVFTQAGRDGVYICNYSYCHYKGFHKSTRNRSLAMIIAATVIVSLVVALIFPGKPVSHAASYSWTQSSWTAADVANTISYDNQGTNGTKYYSVDSGITAGASSVTLANTAGSKGDSSDADFNDTGLAGEWSLDETPATPATAVTAFNDGSGNNNTGTYSGLSNGTYVNGINNGTWYGIGSHWTTAKYGASAGIFDSTKTDYVSTGSSSALNFERTNTFSVFAWVKTAGGANMAIAGKKESTGNNPGYEMVLAAADTTKMQVNLNNTGALYIAKRSSVVITDNAWHYVGFTYSGNSLASGVKIYIDGAEDTSASVVYDGLGANSILNTASFNIGARNGTIPFNGSIDEARVYSKVLSSGEITNLYNNTAVADGLMDYWNFDENSGATVADAHPVWTTAKYGASALNFDGVDDYVEGANTSFPSGANSSTISAWFKMGVTCTSTNGTIFSYGTATTSQARGIQCRNDTTIRFFGWGNDFDVTVPSVGTTTWHHVVVVYDGTNAIIYFDGVNKGSTPKTWNTVSSGVYRIGSLPGTSGAYFNGAIDEVRIYNTALSQSDITNLYNNTPVYSGLAGYWNFDENAGAVAKDTHHLVNSANSKFGNALNFDGVDDYVDIGKGTSIYSSSLPYSISMWVKGPPKAQSTLFGEGNTNNAVYNSIFIMRPPWDGLTGKLEVFIRNDASGILLQNAFSTATVFDDTWHFITWTDNAGAGKLYVDGVLDATNFTYVPSGIFTMNTTSLAELRRAAGSNMLNWGGSIDEVRVYNTALAGPVSGQTCADAPTTAICKLYNANAKSKWQITVSSGLKLGLNKASLGNGADGAITISTAKNINTNAIATGRTAADGVNFSSTNNNPAGANQVIVSTATTTGLAVGDEVVVSNLKGTSGDYTNAGLYETHRVLSITNNAPSGKSTIGLDGNLTNTYDGTTQKIMIQRVPNYTNVTISTGGSLVPSAWDGTKGGVLAFRATGTVTVGTLNGINANEKGYLRGVGCVTSSNRGYGGESYNGASGIGGSSTVAATSAQGGGGGAGHLNFGGGAGGIGTGGGGGGMGDYYSSGGGGGHGSAGNGNYGDGSWGSNGSGQTGGSGGNAVDGGQGGILPGGGGGGGNDGRTANGVGSATLNTRAYFGGGGGASGKCANGGNGGGIVYISANIVNVGVNFSVTSKGGDGIWEGYLQNGITGSGAGGSIIILANQITNSGSISAPGGAFISQPQYGGGGVGRSYARYGALTGTALDSTTTYTSSAVDANLFPYYSSGTYTSQIYDTATNPVWTTMTWADNSVGTITVKARSCDDAGCSSAGTADESVSKAWSVCTNITKGVALSTGGCVGSDRYIQYQATLSTADTTVTPILTGVTMNYTAYANASPALISSPYNTVDSGVLLNQLSWTESGTSGSTIDVKFQIRTSADNSTWGDWVGSGAADGYTTSDYFNDGSYGCSKAGNVVTCSITANKPISDSTNDQWIQYKVWLVSDGTATPTLSSVAIQYVSNSAPCIGTDPTSATTCSNTADTIKSPSQIGVIQNTSTGTISIDSFHITDKEEGTGNPGTKDYDQKASLQYFYDVGATLTNGPLSTGATSLTLSDPDVALPASGTIMIDNALNTSERPEVISYASKSGTTSATLNGLVRQTWPNLATTLNGAIANGTATTAIPLTSVTGLPAAGQVQIDGEVITYTSIVGSSLSGITRAANGTAHSSGAAVWYFPTTNSATTYTTQLTSHTNASKILVLSYSATTRGEQTGISASNAATYSATLTPVSDLNSSGVFLNNSAKIRVAVNDGNIANQVGKQDSAGTFTIDTAKPAYATPTVMKIDSTAASVTLTDISVTENSTLSVRYANIVNNDVSSCGGSISACCSANITSAAYESLVGTTKAWTLSPSTSTGISTVCFQAKDNYGNEQSVTYVSTPATPASPDKADVSYKPATLAKYRSLVWWTDQGNSVYYDIYRNPGPSGSGYGLIGTVQSSTNYCFDEETAAGDCAAASPVAGSLNPATAYTYKILARDSNGNKSAYSTEVTITPDGSTTGEAVNIDAPTIASGPFSNTPAPTETTATITWTTGGTNAASYSLVNYGTNSTTLGSMAGNGTETVTSHSVNLTGLTAGTTYYYQIISAGAATNQLKDPATPPFHSFVTASDSTAPVLDGAPVVVPGRAVASVFWQTNEASTTQIKYIASGGSNTTDPAGGTSVPASAKSEKVRDHYVAIGSGTLATVTSIRVDQGGSGYTTAPSVTISDGGCTTAPTATAAITAGAVTSVAVNTAGAGCTSAPNVSFTGDGTVSATATAEIIFSNGLTAGTTYNYQIISSDAAGNPLTYPSSAPFLQFTTLGDTADSSYPVITDTTSATQLATSATIAFTVTDNSGNAWVLTEYGTSSDLSGTDTAFKGSVSDSPSAPPASIAISGLIPGKTYYYRIYAGDAQGNVTISSSIANFSTAALSISAGPSISSSRSNAVISWTTNGPSDSRVEYGTSATLSDVTFSACPGSNTAADSCTSWQDTTNKVTDHIVSLENLLADTAYYYRVISRDGSNTAKTSSIISFNTNITGALPAITPGSATPANNSAAIAFSATSINSSSTAFFLSVEYEQSDTVPASYTNESAKPVAVSSGVSGTVTLSGLTSNVKYYYKLKVRDAFGNIKTDDNSGVGYSFTTTRDTVVPGTIANLDAPSANLGSTSLTLTWTSSGNDAGVGTATSYDIRYSTDAAVGASAASFDASWADIAKVASVSDEPLPAIAGTAQSMVISSLTPATAYYFAIKASDGTNSSLISNVVTATTLARVDTTIPTITEVSSGTPSSTSATITWKTTGRNSTSLVDFALAADYPNSIFTQGNSNDGTENHSVTLIGLAPGTDYRFRVKSMDSSSKIIATADNNTAGYLFATQTAAQAGTLPVITSVQSSGITASSAVVAWTTNIASDSTVGYSAGDKTYVYEKGLAATGTSHSVTLTSLTPSTQYFYRVKSRNGNELATLSTDLTYPNGFTFTTGAGADNIPPNISNIQVASITSNKATITWTTNEASDSFVEFGTVSGVYTSIQGNPSDSITAHSVQLTSLTPATQYYFQVRSTDAGGNKAVMPYTAGFQTTTGAAVDCPACGRTACPAQEVCPAADITAPKISNIKISDITFNTAAISWDTDEDANSMVGYDTASLGIKNIFAYSAGQSKDAVKTHKVVLRNLDSNTDYFFKISSTDAKGNTADGDQQTFKTISITQAKDKGAATADSLKKQFEDIAQTLVKDNLATEENIKDIISRIANPPVMGQEGPIVKDIKSYGATIYWQTDRKSNSIVKFTTSEDKNAPLSVGDNWREVGKTDTYDTKHEVSLLGLAPSTTYTFKAFSQDVLGNSASSDIKTFTTSSSSSIFNVAITDLGLTAATINWETANLSSTSLEWGLEATYGNYKDKADEKAKKHAIALDNLSSGTTYHYRVRSVEEAGAILSSDDYTFATPDLPQITKYALGEVKDNSISLTWTSNIPIDSTVRYTNKENNETKIQTQEEKITDHILTITSLDAGKTYSIEIQGRDAAGNLATTSAFEVQTGMDTAVPEISQVRSQSAIISGGEEKVQTIISWKTNELSSTRIVWDLGATKGDSFANETKADANLTTNHIAVVTQFKPGTVYRYRVISADKFGNIATSPDYTILTPVKRQSIIQMIVNQFESIFGWVSRIGR